MSENSPRLLNITQVMERTAIGKSAIYARVRSGDFPAPIRLSNRCSRWLESEVNAWITSRRELA